MMEKCIISTETEEKNDKEKSDKESIKKKIGTKSFKIVNLILIKYYQVK